MVNFLVNFLFTSTQLYIEFYQPQMRRNQVTNNLDSEHIKMYDQQPNQGYQIQQNSNQKTTIKSQLNHHNPEIKRRRRDIYENSTVTKGLFFQEQESIDNLHFEDIHLDDQRTQFQTIDTKAQTFKTSKDHKLKPVSKILGEMRGIKVIDQSDMKITPIDQVNIERKRRSRKNNQVKKLQPRPSYNSKTSIKASQMAKGQIQDFVRMNIPQHKKLQVLLKRHRSGLSWFYPHYEMLFQDEADFILSSKRNSFKWGSNYHIGATNQKIDSESPEYSGTVSSNLSGSFWNFYQQKNGKEQLIATITYNHNSSLCSSLCSSLPRMIQVFVISPFYQYSELEGADQKQTKNLFQLAQEGANIENKRIFKLVNKKPKWNPFSEVYEMNFHGRAKESSVKNMILVNQLTNEQVFLLVKYSENNYLSDIGFPLSPRVAMAIITTSFDFKWASQ